MPACKKSCTPHHRQRQPRPGGACSASRREMCQPRHGTCSAWQRRIPGTSVSCCISWRPRSGRASPRCAQHPLEPHSSPPNTSTQGLGQLCTPCVLIPLGCGMGGGASRRNPGLAISSPDIPSDLPASLHETNKRQLTWEGEKEETPSSEPRQAVQEHLALTGSPPKPRPGQESHVPPCESMSGEVGSCRW